MWGLVLVAVMAPVAWFVTRNRPEDVDLVPDGSGRINGSDQPTEDQDEEYSWTAGEAAKTAAFWILMFGICIPSMVGTGARFHRMSIMEANGVSLAAAAVFTVITVTSLVMTPLAGALRDRLPARLGGDIEIRRYGQCPVCVDIRWVTTYNISACGTCVPAVSGFDGHRRCVIYW